MRTMVSSILVLAFAGMAAAQILPPVYYYGFEPGQDPGPAWEAGKTQGDATATPSEQGREGHGIAIEAKSGSTAWSVALPVQPKSVYKLSGWIRTDDARLVDGKNIGVSIGVREYAGVGTPPLLGTNDWAEYYIIFDSGDHTEIHVECQLAGNGTGAGNAWFDDIRLDHLSQDNLYPAVRLHGDQTRDPISKYIYGQFIEHLGRCIYGGIWAEMLEDRKFYYSVGEKDSPWSALGAPDAVTMSTDKPFVGEHTPVVTLAEDANRGITQGGLGLVQGKAYVGYAILAGNGSAEIELAWGSGEQDRAVEKIDGIGEGYRKHAFRFTAGATTDDGHLSISAKGKGTLKIGTVSIMPADNIDGMRADTLAVLKELNAPVYRWPGGNFVSGYDWHDGIGDRDKRPPRKNPAWKGVEHNDFGADEFHRYLKEVNADGYLVVNSGLGTVEDAVEEVQYHLGAAGTPGGKKRAENGHRAPYALKFIGIGNEMYGDWQLGHMPIEDYIKKHNQFADALRKEAPKVEFVGVGDSGSNWSQNILKGAAANMDLLSEHFYCGARPEPIAHVLQIPDNIRQKAERHRSYFQQIPELRGKQIPICMDEWNYWYGPHRYGELGTQYYLNDALGIAEGLHAFYRATDAVFMANYAQTVNVIGCIKTSKTAACLDTTGVVLALYRREFGTLPIEIEGNSFPVDVAAAWTKDKSEITISVVNPTHEAYEVALGVEGMTFPTGGKRWSITGPETNAKNLPGETPEVTVKEEVLTGTVKALPAPPLSATLYRLKVQ